MYNKKRMRPSADAIDMIMRLEWMITTGTYDTVNSTPSNMDDPSTHFLEYTSYLFSISVFKNPKIYSGSEYLCV